MATTLLERLSDPLGDRVDEQVALQAIRQAQAMLGLLRPPPPSLPLASVRSEPPPRVVAALGLGADSSAILTRYIKEPSIRDFELHELVVITANIFSSLQSWRSDQCFCVGDMSLTQVQTVPEQMTWCLVVVSGRPSAGRRRNACW
jgi:hypothetical protein